MSKKKYDGWVTAEERSAIWSGSSESPDLRPFPFIAPHEQRIAELEAENGRQAERIHELESALLRIHGLALIGKEHPTAGNFKRILRHITNALDEEVRP